MTPGFGVLYVFFDKGDAEDFLPLVLSTTGCCGDTAVQKGVELLKDWCFGCPRFGLFPTDVQMLKEILDRGSTLVAVSARSPA